MTISEKQHQLLLKIFKQFSEKYPQLTLTEFILKFTNKTIKELTHKDFFFFMNKVNSNYDYWRNNNEFNSIKINFYNMKYIKEIETDDYIIGTQKHKINGDLKIISFSKLMILDYDNITLETLESYLKNFPYTFMIYETKNGYHCYNISKEFDYFEKDTLQLMFDLKCDPYYINFTKYVGFVTRLEKKKNRDEDFVEKYIKQINNYPIITKLKNLVEFKDTLIKH